MRSTYEKTLLKTSAVAELQADWEPERRVFVTSCSGEKKDVTVPPERTRNVIRAEWWTGFRRKRVESCVVGCGGRGSGAAMNFLNAANGVTIVALGDVFEDKVNGLADKLKAEKSIDVPADKRFVGLDAYKQVIDSGIDILIDCTPPFFRAEHFKYAVDQGKHCFLKKSGFVIRWIPHHRGDSQTGPGQEFKRCHRNAAPPPTLIR